MTGLRPTHVFLSTWLRQKTEAENIRINSLMVRNVLDALSSVGSVRHVALVTGLKHYLGPFEAYGKGNLPPTPFREQQPRLDVENSYYAQEDEVFTAAKRDGDRRANRGNGFPAPPLQRGPPIEFADRPARTGRPKGRQRMGGAVASASTATSRARGKRCRLTGSASWLRFAERS
jgi:hypothetical protein